MTAIIKITVEKAKKIIEYFLAMVRKSPYLANYLAVFDDGVKD
jgi:hypothetical protein